MLVRNDYIFQSSKLVNYEKVSPKNFSSVFKVCDKNKTNDILQSVWTLKEGNFNELTPSVLFIWGNFFLLIFFYLMSSYLLYVADFPCHKNKREDFKTTTTIKEFGSNWGRFFRSYALNGPKSIFYIVSWKLIDQIWLGNFRQSNSSCTVRHSDQLF